MTHSRLACQTLENLPLTMGGVEHQKKPELFSEKVMT